MEKKVNQMKFHCHNSFSLV